MSISEEFEKFKEEQTQYEAATSNVASLMSVYDTMEFQKKQTASDRALNVAKAFYNGAVSQTIGGALRGLQWLRDVNEAQLNAENPDRMPMDEGARKLLDDAADAEFLQPYNVRADSSGERFAYDIVQGTGQLSGQVAVGYLTGGYGVIPSMALQIGGTEYKELRDKGVDVQTAGDAALFNATVQTPLEYIGFSKITKAFPGNTMLKQRIMKLAENAFTEGVTEFLQEYPEQASAIWAAQSSGSSPKSADVVAKEIAKTAWDNLGKIAPDAAYSGLIGGILGGGAGGLHLALDRDINHAMQREVHSALVEEEEHRIEEIKRSGINPPYAAAVINDNMQGQSVYVDGETLQGYAQEKGADKVAESLGVTVEDIEKAAANGDTVDIKLGNFEATGAAFDGFFDAVKESTAFEDGGYTPQKDRVEQELAKKAKAQEEAIHSESERITDELIRAGVSKEQASNALAVITARAMNTDDPAAFLKKLSYKFGGEGTRVQLAQTANPVKGITEKPSSTNGDKSTFFTLDSDVMDVSGHIPENGTPFIDNLWYKEKYAKDPTDASTVSPEVKGKGIAKSHVLSAIGYFKGKGFDRFKIKTMSQDSNALMKRLEQEGYVQALNEWQEGGDVEYRILKEVGNEASEIGDYSDTNKEGLAWIAENPFVYDESKSVDENIAAAEKLAQEYLDNFGETNKINTPERQELRLEVANKLYGEGAKKKDGKVWLIVGVPAAGKSTISDPIVEKEGALLIDSDEAKKLLPEFSNGLLATAVHEESSDIVSDVLGMAMDAYDNIVMPVVGKTYSSLKSKIDYFSSEGYEVNLIYVALPVEKAVDRVKNRFREEGRLVSPSYLESVGLKPKENYDTLKLREEVDSYEAWNNDVERGARPVLIERSVSNESAETSSRLGRLRDKRQRMGALRAKTEQEKNAGKTSKNSITNEQAQSHSDNQGGFPYAQNTGELKGGFDPNTNIITLFKGADASTVIHETWHFFIEQMWQSVQDGTASEQTVKDFNSLLEYAGMTQDEWAKADVEGRRKAHERLAEAGETYVMEGNAPSVELKRVFANFAKWLRKVYETIKRNENAAELTDEVREVFDRMLAAEEDIAHMERVNGYFAKLPEVITENMSDATRKRVEKYIEKARDKAVAILTKRALRNYTKQRREEIKKFKEEIRPSVEAEVGRRREYACGYTQKDVERYNKLQKQKSEVGVWSDDDKLFLLTASLTAETYGFSSADEMMKAVEAAPKKSEAVEARIKERVEELSSADEQENYARSVQEALYNEDEALLIGVEQQLIEDYARKAKGQQIERAQTATITADIAAARRQQAKLAAAADLSQMNIKEATRTNRFIAAERKAAVKSAELLAKKKFDEALAQKNLQAYWHAMAAESIKIQKRKQQYEKFLKRQVKLKQEAWLNDEHFGAISQLFVRMGIAKDIHRQAAEDSVSLASYTESMEQQFDCVDIAEWILDESVPISNTNNLTLEQYEDVVNAVKNIKAIVKAEKGVNAFNRNETWAETKKLMMEKLSALKTRFVPNPNKPTKASALERWTVSMENLDTFLEMLDNATYGFFSKTWGYAIKHAADHEYECLDKYNKADAEALKKWLPDKAAEQAANEEVYYKELGTSVTRHTLVKLLINLGNADNAKRLCETAPVGFEHGRIWIIPDEGASKADRQQAAAITRENLIRFLEGVLTEEDVEYAQRKINAAEMFWGEKNDLEKRMKGFGLKKVEATPVELTIDGKPVVLRGGYFPLMRNGETGSHAAAAEVAEDDPLQGKRIRTYHTNTGATKARTQARYPVNLFPGAETQWIYESIHDLCWREVMGDFRRVMNDQELFAMLKKKVGVARMNVFKELLEVSADPRNSKPLSEGEKMLGDAASWLRQRTSHAVIMLNLKVIMQNYANAFLYGNAVEGYTMADNIQALGTYMLKYHTPGSHKEMFDFVTSKSVFMRERCELPDITVRDIVDEKKEFVWEKVSREMGIKAMALTDNATAMPNWLQAYNKKLNEGATEQEAIDFADTIVRRVLGSSRITDVASMQRGGPIMKILTMFQSFFNARWNEFIRTKRLASKQWTQGQKQEAFANMFSYVISKWLGQTMLAMALALQNPLGVDDKDDYPELLKELKSYSFTMMGPVGQVGSYILGKAMGMHEFDYRMSAIESTVDKVGRAAAKVSSDKATAQDKAENVIDTMTMMVGLPSQINRIFWNVFDMTFNDMSPEWGDIMRRRPKKERK